MPTKRNRAGNQQNYIPEGNGDRSGEYSNNETQQNSNTISKNNNTKTLKSNSVQHIQSYINKFGYFSDEEKNFINEIVDNGNEQCNNILKYAFDKYNPDIIKNNTSSFYDSRFNRVNLKLDINNKENDVISGNLQKDLFYHECGHLLDYRLSNGLPISSQYVSNKYNCTLRDMLKEENKNINDVYYDLLDKKETEEYNLLSQNGFDYEFLGKYNTANEQYEKEKYSLETQYKDNQDFIYYKLYNGEIDNNTVESMLKELDKDFNNNNELLNNKYKDFLNNKTKVESLKKQAKSNFLITYNQISDMIDAGTHGKTNLGAGHGRDYWSNDSDNINSEFFAETFQAKAMNSQNYNIIKKYYPKSVEIFEEILGSVKYENS